MSTLGAGSGKERSGMINFWIFLLVIALLALIANAVLSAKYSGEEARARDRVADIRVLSQQVAKAAQDAASGGVDAFDELQSTRERIQSNLDALNNGGDDYLKRVLANYPAFVVGEVTIDFVPLFKNRNFYKEIGSETEELFKHNLERLADEIYTRNAIQINAYLAQADTFTQRSIDDTDTTTDYAYLNPVDAPAVINNQAKLAGATKRTYDFKVWLGGNKSNAELVKEIADLYALYNDMLDSFDILFLGVH